MGDMAEEAYIEALMEEFNDQVPGWLKIKRVKAGIKLNKNNLYTEEVLNSKNWVDTNGQIHNLETMDKDHLRNVLKYLYKRKDHYWLNCRNAKLIEQFDNGEDFFQRVIRRSTLWQEGIRVLTTSGTEGFNFEVELRG